MFTRVWRGSLTQANNIAFTSIFDNILKVRLFLYIIIVENTDKEGAINRTNVLIMSPMDINILRIAAESV